MNITSEQIQFIDEYFSNYNATKAYQKVYGCSYNSARSAAARLLNHFPIVERYYQLRKKELNLAERKAELAKHNSRTKYDKHWRFLLNNRYPPGECLSAKERKEIEQMRMFAIVGNC